MRPRERYLLTGHEGLGDIELIALVLGTGAGGRSPREIGTELLERHGSAAQLASLPPAALATVRGVGPARAVRLHAALALGRRAVWTDPPHDTPVKDAAAAAAWFVPALDGLDHEELHALMLDTRLRPLGYRRLTSGTERATLVDPRQVFRKALQMGASALILGHNHPSGTLAPSVEDHHVTAKVREMGKQLEIPLLDHLLVAGGRWVSVGKPESEWE